MTYEMISEQLINKGICKSAQSANATESYMFKWLHNSPIDKRKRQYYVHRARLLKLGFDIAIPHDITRLPPQIRSSEIIDFRLAAIPAWYQMPEIGELKAA